MHSGSEIELFPVTVRLGATLFFVLLNGFFVAAEFALVKVRRSPACGWQGPTRWGGR